MLKRPPIISRIAHILEKFDADKLEQAECFFGAVRQLCCSQTSTANRSISTFCARQSKAIACCVKRSSTARSTRSRRSRFAKRASYARTVTRFSR